MLSKDEINKFRTINPTLKANTIVKNLPYLQNVNAAIETILYLFKYLDEEAERIVEKKISVIEMFFNNYKYDEFKRHELLKKYNIQQKGNVLFYNLSSNVKNSYTLQNKFTVKSLDPIENIFLKVQAMSEAFYCSILNNHTEAAETILSDIFTRANISLTLMLNTKNYAKHKECTETLFYLLKFMKTDFQVKFTKELVSHIKYYFDIVNQLSEMLINNNYYDEACKLLEETINNNSTGNNFNKEDKGFCLYRLAHIYEVNCNDKLAEKYYKYALSFLPNNENIMFSLWANYKMTDRHEEAANIILQMPLGNVKYLLEMLNNLYEINKEKLNLIDINTLLPQYLPMLNCCKYIAKYNSFSDKERSIYKEELKQELKEIFKFSSDKLLILSTALYTKQVEVAHDVLKTIPKKDMQIYKNFAILQSYLDPDPILYDESEFKEEVIVEILNTASTSLMAEEKTTAALKNIEKSLKYDPQNEEALEIGVAAALLAKDKEKAQGYLNQLSEEKQQEIAVNYNAENIEEVIEKYNPKEIHAHYQRVKQQKLFEISQKITNNQIISSWNVNKHINASFVLIKALYGL